MATVTLSNLPELAPEDIRADDILLVQRTAEAEPNPAQRDRKLALGSLIDATLEESDARYKSKSYSPVSGTTVAADGSGDYTTIEAGIAAAPSGATIFVKRGTYNPTVMLAPKASQTIRGEGKGATIIQAPIDSGRNAFRLEAAGVRIENLAINGQKALQPDVQSNSAYQGIHVVAPDCTVRDVRIFGTRNHAVWVETGGDNFTLRDSSIENESITTAVPGWSYYGVQLYGLVKNGLIQNNLITGWAQAVGLWYGVRDTVVEGNNIVDNYGFTDAAHTQTRSACEDFGGTEPGHGRNKWLNNIVDGSTSHCLEIAQGVDGSQFIGNTLRNPSLNFWSITGQVGQETSRILIQGNNCESAPASVRECAIVGLVHDTRIINNIHNRADIFVGAAAGSTGTIIESNTFKNGVRAIFVNSVQGAIKIIGNIFKDCSIYGIYFQSDAQSSVVHIIRGNTITSSTAGFGIGINGNEGSVRIEGNTINTFNTPIRLVNSANFVFDNDLRATVNAEAGGIIVFGARNQIKNNSILDVNGRSRDIYITGGSTNIVQNNTLAHGSVIVDGGGVNNTVTPNYDLSGAVV